MDIPLSRTPKSHWTVNNLMSCRNGNFKKSVIDLEGWQRRYEGRGRKRFSGGGPQPLLCGQPWPKLSRHTQQNKSIQPPGHIWSPASLGFWGVPAGGLQSHPKWLSRFFFFPTTYSLQERTSGKCKCLHLITFPVMFLCLLLIGAPVGCLAGRPLIKLWYTSMEISLGSFTCTFMTL